jgi:Mn2+/Fe2+ NRAMP family transporter
MVAAMVMATAAIFMPVDPIRMLFWTAVINGVISVPILAAMMVLSRRHRQMGAYVAHTWQHGLGWAATLVMALAVAAMFIFD